MAGFAMTWWIWLLMGLVLLAAEVLTPGGFYLLFFGCGGVAVGLLVALNLVPELWQQWLLFSAFSIGSLALFRRPLLAKMKASIPQKLVDSLVGEAGVAMEDIPANGLGKVELRGTSWNARNNGAQALLARQRCLVERVDGLTLHIRPE